MTSRVDVSADGRQLLLPDGSGEALLIVCERDGRWSTALRLRMPQGLPQICETRVLDDCWATLRQCPASFVVVELTETGADALLDRLACRERLFPLVRVAVVADRQLADYEPLVREAGAIHFTTSIREAAPLADLARRHLDRAPRPDRTHTEKIFDRLPWRPAN